MRTETRWLSRFLSLAGPAMLGAVLGLAAPVAAQTNTAPRVTINAMSNDTQALQNFNIPVCDDRNLDVNGRKVWWNGTDVTSQFTWTNGSPYYNCNVAASLSGGQYANLGLNTLRVRVCDLLGYNYTPYGPLCADVTRTVRYRNVDVPNLAATTRPHSSAGQFVDFNVNWLTGLPNTFILSVTCTGSVSNCALQSTTISGSGTARVTFTTGALNTTGTITLRAATSGYAESFDDGSVTITNSQSNRLIVSTAQNTHDNQALGACEADCFAATARVSTVPYISMGAPQSVSFAYHGDRDAVRPFVFADVSLTEGPVGENATELRLELLRPNGAGGNTAVQFLNGETTLRFAPGNAAIRPVRLANQFDAIANGMGATGMYPATLVVTALFNGPNGLREERREIPTRFMIVNERNSKIARSWTVAGVQRLYNQTGAVQGALITNGDGSAQFFEKSGSSYIAPAGDFTTLQYDGGAAWNRRWTRTTVQGTKYYFDEEGYLTAAVDRLNLQVTYAYDVQRRLEKISDAYPAPTRYTTLGYDANGLAWVEEPAFNNPNGGGRRTSFTVDANRLLRAVQDPDSLSTQFGYDGLGRLHLVTSRSGHTAEFVYRTDPSWKLWATLTPPVEVEVNGTQQTQKLETRYEPWQVWDLPTGPTNGTYNPPDVQSIEGKVGDPSGRWTRFTVDRWGQPLRITDPLQLVTTYSRDTHGRATIVSYPTGSTDEYGYTGAFLTSQRNGSGQPTMFYNYGVFGQLSYVTGNGPSVRHFLDPLGRVDSTTIGGGNRIAYTYGLYGRVAQVTDAEGHVTRYTYEPTWGNADSVITHDGRWTRTVYDRHGRDSVSMSSGRPVATTVLYDRVNRPIETYDGVNALPTRMTYEADRLTRVTDPKNQLYRKDYNALGWVTREYDPRDQARYVQYTFTRDGAVASKTNLRGQRVAMAYDAVGRPQSVSDPVSGSVLYGYNQLGTMTWAESRALGGSIIAVDTTFSSAIGWVDSVVTRLNGRRFRRHYRKFINGSQIDSIGITSDTETNLTFAQRRFYYNLNSGTLDSLLIGSSWRVAFGRSRDRIVNSTTFMGSVVRNTSVTGDHRVASHGFPTSGALGEAFTRVYGYDAVGRIATEQSRLPGGSGWYWSDRIRSFGYDALGRHTRTKTETLDYQQSCVITDEWGSQDCWIDQTGQSTTHLRGLEHDQVANITKQTDSLTLASIFANLETPNRLRTWGAMSYDYDLDGNMISRSGPNGTTTFGWSASSELMWAAQGADTTFFDYDAGGQLVRRRRGGNTERWFLWDQGQLLVELDGTAKFRQSEYVYYPGSVDQPLAMIRGAGWSSNIHWFQQDVIGNVAGLFTSAGGLAQTLEYDEWGNVTASSSSIGDLTGLRWKGLYYEGGPVGLYFMRARWYDPVARRFMSQDPIGLGGGINQYAFANADPINNSDPTGLYCYANSGAGAAMGSAAQYCNGSVAQWQYSLTDYTSWESLTGFHSQQLSAYRRREEMALRGQMHPYEAGLLGAGDLLTPAEPVLEAIANAELSLIMSGLGTLRSGVTILGNYPKYLNVAGATGASAFNIGERLYGLLGKDATWVLNSGFIRLRALMGDSFMVAFESPGVIWRGGRVGRDLLREVQLLKSLNYRQVGNWFIR